MKQSFRIGSFQAFHLDLIKCFQLHLCAISFSLFSGYGIKVIQKILNCPQKSAPFYITILLVSLFKMTFHYSLHNLLSNNVNSDFTE